MEKRPKVLVGCPTSEHKEYCLEEYARAIKNLTYKNCDILLVDNSKEDTYLEKIKEKGINVTKGHWFEGARKRIYESRNLIREKFLEQDYDYFFSLEQDVIPPANVIEKLLERNKKIVSGVYYSPGTIFTEQPQGGKIMPLAWVSKDDKNLCRMRILNPEEVEEPRLMKIKVCGLGCVLMHRDVLEKVKFRCDEFFGLFDDIWFCRDANHYNFDIYLDTRIKCKHMVAKRKSVWVDMKW